MKPTHAPRVLLALLLAPGLHAQEVLDQRARQAAGIVAAEPRWADDLFDPAFLKQVPPARLQAIGKDFFAKCGALVEMQPTQRKGEFSATYDLIFDQDLVVSMSVAISERAPHAVIGLLFGQPMAMMTDLNAAKAQLQELPGAVSFAVWKLGGEQPEVLAELEPDESLAIGSAFKLYVLGALVQDVTDGTRKPGDVVTLEARNRSMPSGQMHDWPDGTPVTLATLAAMMISISDNTATDNLLFALGRERVEAQLTTMGNAAAARSIPLLATHELFHLKMTRAGKGADAYVKLDLAAKRAYLAETVAGDPFDRTQVELGSMTTPNRIDTVEWFASANDLCRALDWLRENTASGPAAPLRDVLSINRGLDVSPEQFPWAGFKGGSEPGVLNLTFLLNAKDGSWYALAVTWNNAADAVEESKLFALVQRAIYVLGKSIPAEQR